MKKNISIPFLPLLSLLLFTASCNTTDPSVDNIKPGRRDYTWTEYTLNSTAPNNYYTKIWGSEPNDIWIVGSAGDFDKSILKFDGKSIHSIGYHDINPRSVFGILKNNVWFTGSEFDFWKYDGTQFYKYSTNSIGGYTSSFLSGIWGDNVNNVFAVGGAVEQNTQQVKNLIFHFNGNEWSPFVYPNSQNQFFSILKGFNDTKYYLVGFSDSTGMYNFFELNENNISTIKIGNDPNSTDKSIALLNNVVYFFDAKEIYKSNYDKIEFVVSLINTEVTGAKMWGRGVKDFFIQTQEGLGHYNGTDLETLYQLTGNYGIVDGVIFSNAVDFIVFDRDTFTYYLLEGKINN